MIFDHLQQSCDILRNHSIGTTQDMLHFNHQNQAISPGSTPKHQNIIQKKKFLEKQTVISFQSLTLQQTQIKDRKGEERVRQKGWTGVGPFYKKAVNLLISQMLLNDYSLQQYQMKKQVLNIDFKEDQGVILNWNYSDLSRKTKYFRHVIVLATGDSAEAQAFLEDYIKLIKPGDLFTAIYKPRFQQIKFKEWREKTYGHNFSPRSYLGLEEIQTFNLQQGFRFIQNSLQQISEAIVLNFLLQKTDHIPAIKSQVREWQQGGRMRFVNSIFSPMKESSIAVSEGVNLLNLKEPGLLEFYHQHIGQAAVEYAHLTITCRNGQLSSCSQTGWCNSAFNKIERYYHAPTGKYSRDILHIINTKIIFTGSYELEVALTLKTFAGTVYKSEKKLVINFNHSEFYNRTVVVQKRKKVFVSADDIQLEESPYSSETLVCFQKDIKGSDSLEV